MNTVQAETDLFDGIRVKWNPKGSDGISKLAEDKLLEDALAEEEALASMMNEEEGLRRVAPQRELPESTRTLCQTYIREWDKRSPSSQEEISETLALMLRIQNDHRDEFETVNTLLRGETLTL